MWHEGEGKACSPKYIGFSRRSARFTPQNHGTWPGRMVREIGRPNRKSADHGPALGLAGGRIRNPASAVRRDGRLSERERRQIDHLGQAVTAAFEQDLPLHLGRAE